MGWNCRCRRLFRAERLAVNTYAEEANDELKRDKNRKEHPASVDKMECSECGKEARSLTFCKTKDGLKCVCKECKKGLK